MGATVHIEIESKNKDIALLVRNKIENMISPAHGIVYSINDKNLENEKAI
jgi:hypothetical protein